MSFDKNKLEITYVKFSIFIFIPIFVSICFLKSFEFDRDVLDYIDRFNDIQPLSIGSALLSVFNGGFGVEFFFDFISSIAKHLDFDFRFVLFVYAVIGVSLKFFAFSRFDNLYWIVVLLYFTSWFFIHDLTQIRASVAISFALIASYLFHFKRNKKIGVAILFLSVFIHLSAALYIPVFYFCDYFESRKSKIFLLFLCVLSFFLNIINPHLLSTIMPSFQNDGFLYKISMYQERVSNGEYDSINIFNVRYLTVLFLLIANCFYFNPNTKESSVFFNFTAVGYILFNLFSQGSVFAFRLSELCLIYFVHLVSLSIRESKSVNLKCLIFVIYMSTGLYYGVSNTNALRLIGF